MKIILLNGPPRSGKDTAGRVLRHRLQSRGFAIMEAKFAQALKEGVHASYSLIDENGRAYRHDHYEDDKDNQLDEFFGLTPRQAYIEMAENHMRRLHGRDFYGRLLADRVRGSGVDFVVITDCGFASEVETIVKEFGAEQCVLVRLHRAGCDFSKDSRSFIQLDAVASYDAQNDSDVEHLGRQLEIFLRNSHFFDEPQAETATV